MKIKDCGSYYLYNENAVNNSIILTCEHGGKLLPEEYDTLGISSDDLNSTIMYDIGAAETASFLAEKLGCRLFLGKYSRILIDLNRAVYHPHLIKNLSHRVIIPGNCNLSDSEYLKRINEFYYPYRFAINDFVVSHPDVYILSVHSFTPRPRFMREIRPWHVCVGFSEKNFLSEYILKALSSEKNIVVGENKPFNLMKKDKNGNGIAYKYGKKGKNAVLFEMRNDFIQNTESQKEWADKIFSYLPENIKI